MTTGEMLRRYICSLANRDRCMATRTPWGHHQDDGDVCDIWSTNRERSDAVVLWYIQRTDVSLKGTFLAKPKLMRNILSIFCMCEQREYSHNKWQSVQFGLGHRIEVWYLKNRDNGFHFSNYLFSFINKHDNCLSLIYVFRIEPSFCLLFSSHPAWTQIKLITRYFFCLNPTFNTILLKKDNNVI